MWWPTQARAPLATQNVLLSSAPHASSGRVATGSGSESGTNPRERRSSSEAPALGHRAQHRVVRPRVDRAVVEQHDVGDRVEPLERVVVLVRDRLVGDVAARHHERLAGVGEQQVVQRRVREQHAEVGRAGATDVGTGASARARREHDRAVAAGEQRRLLVGRARRAPAPPRRRAP